MTAVTDKVSAHIRDSSHQSIQKLLVSRQEQLRTNDRQNPERTSAAVDNLQWRSDYYGAHRGELIQITKTGQPKLACTVHDMMIRKRRIESARLPGIRSDRLNADASHVAIVREKRTGF